jgi:hypothetical protein
VVVNYTSEWSQMPVNQRTQFDYFWIKIWTTLPPCYDDVLTKSGEMADWPYTVYDTAQSDTNMPDTLFTSTFIADCDISQYLFFWSEALNSWVDFASHSSDYPFMDFTSGVNTGNIDLGLMTINVDRTTLSGSYFMPQQTYKLNLTLGDELADP